jgi:L-threonylcarbamoyladenylate synthase
MSEACVHPDTRRLDATRETDIGRAACMIRSGGLVAFGTETVYGLGADATNERALAAIFAAKGRPLFNPLICHFADAASAFRHVRAGALARDLAARFWPGPLTLVLRREPSSPVGLLASAGLDTLAVRVPRGEGARALLRAAGVPVAAPSANRSGGVSPSSAVHVLNDLDGRIDAVLDCGDCPVGVESTVLDLTGERLALLRPGGIAVEDIEAVTGEILLGVPAAQEAGLRSPGLLASHYAPRAPLRLNAAFVGPGEALLAFGPFAAGGACCWQLSETGDLTEAASRLFAGLRWLDGEVARLGLAGIAAMPVPDRGLGRAVNDRLLRAAAPRGLVI